MKPAVDSLLTRPSDMVCRCMAYEPPELYRLWQRRALPTVRRLLAHGHCVDHGKVQMLVNLMRGIENGRGDSFSLAHWGCSHHLPDCQFHSHRTPKATVSTAPEAQWQVSR